ncbi:MAG: phosphotransferase [Candidatus Latescibacteria bacterium]|nr:phosphotransferase [Candidatus Latescibacterota bacterium]
MNTKELFFILHRAADGSILLVREGSIWRLPAYPGPVPEDIGFVDPHPFNDWFTDRYGIPVKRRYPLVMPEADEAFFVLESEPSADALTQEVSWIKAADLNRLVMQPSAHQDLLRNWSKTPPQSATVPAAAPAGYQASLSWMHQHLENRKTPLTGPIRQIKNAYVSTVFQGPTRNGSVYLKIIPPVFIREVEITTQLAEWGFVRLPEMIALSPERGLILSQDMGGCDLTDCPTRPHMEALLRTYAQIQLAAIDRIKPQSPAPFYDTRLSLLSDQLEALFASATAHLEGSPYALNADEKHRLQRQLPTWRQRCQSILQTPLPDTLDHGDLRPGNIRITADGLILYDWAWSALTHPFVGVVGFLHIIRRTLDSDDRNFLRDTYLESWSNYASGDQLRRLFDQVAEILPLLAVAIDGAWLKAIEQALQGRPPVPLSTDAYTLGWRQYYHNKVLRRLF